MPYMSYDILLGTKIKEQQYGHISNIYVENDKDITVISNGIGFKRYLSQKLYNLKKKENKELCYCCIDSTTCLLSGKDYTKEQMEDPIDKQGKVFVKSVNIKNKVLWEKGIKQFFEDRNKHPGNLVYGFKKFTDNSITAIEDTYVDSSSIYKFIFWNNECENISDIFYDPFCIELKEDVDWLFRAEKTKKYIFKKNVSFSLCKLGSNNCTEEKTPSVSSSIKTLKENTLNYYYNLLNRSLMHVFSVRKNIQYTIIEEKDLNDKVQWYCLFTLPSITIMKSMELHKVLVERLAEPVRTLKDQYQDYPIVRDNLGLIEQNGIGKIMIRNPLGIDYTFSRHCGFGSYMRATFQILKAFGIAYVNFDKEHPSKLYSEGERTLSAMIEKLIPVLINKPSPIF